VRLLLPSTYDTLYVGFAFKSDLIDSTNHGIRATLAFAESANTYCFGIYINEYGAIQVTDSYSTTPSVLATSSNGVISANTYQYIEIYGYVHSTNGAVTVKVDGTTVLTATNINTDNNGGGAVQYLTWGGTQRGDTMYFCDLIIMDDTGASFNTFQGDVAVVGHFPESDTDTDWASTQANHYDAVNDTGGNTWNTDYITGQAVAQQDSFKTTIDTTYPSILGVEVALHGYNDTGGTAKVTPFVRISGVVYYGTELTMPAGSSEKVSYVWPTNPATGTLWSQAVIEAADWGFEVTTLI